MSLLGLQRSDINPKNSSIHFTKSVKPRSNFVEQKCVFSRRNNFCHSCQNKQTAIFGNWHGCTKSWKKKSNVSFMSKVPMYKNNRNNDISLLDNAPPYLVGCVIEKWYLWVYPVYVLEKHYGIMPLNIVMVKIDDGCVILDFEI